MKKSIQVPITKDGLHQLTWEYGQTTKLVDNFEFAATLQYNGFSRGRSALNIEWLNVETGCTYQSGMSLLDEALLGNNNVYPDFQQGIFNIGGKFTFKKQGTSVLLTNLKE